PPRSCSHPASSLSCSAAAPAAGQARRISPGTRALSMPSRSQPRGPVQGDFEMKTRLHIVTVVVCAVSALGVTAAQAKLQAQLVSENGSFVLAQAHSSSSTLAAMQKAGTSYHASAKVKGTHSARHTYEKPFGYAVLVSGPLRAGGRAARPYAASMRAMVFDSLGEPLRKAELEQPVPGHGQVRLRVLGCGVCRTDLHIVDGELPQPKLPLVLGHQIVGTVAEL